MLTLTATLSGKAARLDRFDGDFAALHVRRVALNLGVPAEIAARAGAIALLAGAAPGALPEDAIAAGLRFVSLYLRATSLPPAREPFAWVESWWFGVLAVFVVSSLLLARIAGWVP